MQDMTTRAETLALLASKTPKTKTRICYYCTVQWLLHAAVSPDVVNQSQLLLLLQQHDLLCMPSLPASSQLQLESQVSAA